MRLSVIIISILVFAMTGCKSKSAFDYSQKLVSIEKSLIPDIRETESKVVEFFTNQQYDSAAAVSERMEGKVDARIKEVTAMEAPKVPEGENFKKAYLNYFAYIKSIYTLYKNYALQTDEQKREEMRQDMGKVDGEKREAVAEMQAAQSRFAKANGFKIEGK